MARPPEGAAVSGREGAIRAAQTTARTGRAEPEAASDAKSSLRARELDRTGGTKIERGAGKSGILEGGGTRNTGARGHGPSGGRMSPSGRGAKGGGRGGSTPTR